MSPNQELECYVRGRGVDFVGVTTVAPFCLGDEGSIVDPKELMPEAKSLVVTGFYTYTDEPVLPSVPGTPRGRFGPWTRLSRPAIQHQAEVVGAFFRKRGYRVRADGRLPAKPAAVRAGWASYGKNCIIHAPGAGSYIKINAFLTDAPLETVQLPIQSSDCGDCDECIRACPTGALTSPYHLDRARCICTWLWGDPIPRELRHTVGNHLHRCSYCQDACPLNKGLKPRDCLPFEPDGPTPSPELPPLLLGDDDLLRKSLPAFVMSAGAGTIRRNVALALGNVGDPVAIGPLGEALRDGPSQVRAYAAWALGQIGGNESRRLLAQALAGEEDGAVVEEIAEAARRAG